MCIWYICACVFNDEYAPFRSTSVKAGHTKGRRSSTALARVFSHSSKKCFSSVWRWKFHLNFWCLLVFLEVVLKWFGFATVLLVDARTHTILRNILERNYLYYNLNIYNYPKNILPLLPNSTAGKKNFQKMPYGGQYPLLLPCRPQTIFFRPTNFWNYVMCKASLFIIFTLAHWYVATEL